MLPEADTFVRNLPFKALDKMAYNIKLVAAGAADTEIFKKLHGSDIWEIRALFNGIAYRLFAFWDTRDGALMVATHGIIKKRDKVPRKEIEKAERIRIQYFNQQS